MSATPVGRDPKAVFHGGGRVHDHRRTGRNPGAYPRFGRVARAEFDRDQPAPAVDHREDGHPRTRPATACGSGNTALTGTLVRVVDPQGQDANADPIAVAERRHCSGGLVMSISTLTRCSSTPSAETFVKAAGSTRRTRPSSAPSPPQRSIRTRRPGLGLQRVGGQQLGDDLDLRGCRRARAAACRARRWPRSAAATRSTRPPTGARTAKLRAACRRRRAPPAARRAPARPRARRRARSACAASSSFCAASARAGRCRAWSARRSPARASCSVRSTSLFACSSATLARSMRASTRLTCASAISTRTCCSRSVRSSTIGASTGVSIATTAPAATVSPSRSVDARQHAGERRRDDVAVAQPRLAVLVDRRLEAARASRVATSTSTGRGANAQASSGDAPTAPSAARTQRFFDLHAQSLVFRAATMSSRSMRRRTTSALATPAASTQSAAHA